LEITYEVVLGIHETEDIEPSPKNQGYRIESSHEAHNFRHQPFTKPR
jgi:hypothetical protein